jgi:predicted neutral ceramidase superfamily lipid hydrolase
MLEHYAEKRHNTTLITGHCAINEDRNPLSASQFVYLRNALDKGIRFGRKVNVTSKSLTYSQSSSNHATVRTLGFGAVGLVTLTRAPKVSEDIHNDASEILKQLFVSKGIVPILIDAHNSRYEEASESELHWVTADSQTLRDYIDALEKMGDPEHSAKKVRVGVSALDIYLELGAPKDIAPGKLNCLVFQFNDFKYAMLYVNSNNVLPHMRNLMIEHIMKKLRVHAELYTTDTHYVNSLERGASNVLGRHTKASAILPFMEQAVKTALDNIEEVDVYYKKETLKSFRVWGPNTRERMEATLNPVIRTARILVPIIVIGGFIIATLVISSV